jgi:hypothetical protein
MWEKPGRDQPLILEIYDPPGRLILKQAISSQRQEITLPGSEKGVYFYRLLRGNNGSEMQKIIRF